MKYPKKMAEKVRKLRQLALENNKSTLQSSQS